MLKKKSRVFSLSETWNEYLSLVDKVLPDKAKVIVSNKKIFLPLVTLAVVQLVVYSGIAIYWLLF